MVKNKKVAIILMMIILGTGMSLFSAQALTKETPNLSELVQKIYDGVRTNTNLINSLSDSLQSKFNELGSIIRDEHRTTNTKIDDVYDKVEQLKTDENNHYIDLRSWSKNTHDQVDEVKANQATIMDYVDGVEANQVVLLGEVDQVEEILFEVRMWQDVYNTYRNTEHGVLSDTIIDNYDAIEALQASVDEALGQLDDIEAALSRLEARAKSNVIMKTDEVSFTTDSGNSIVYSASYSSVRHVSLSGKVWSIIDGVGMSLDETIVSIFVDLPDDGLGIYKIHSGNWETLHNFEFDTDYWEIHVGKTMINDYTTEGRFYVVTFEID